MITLSLSHLFVYLFTSSFTQSLTGIAGSIHECVDYRFHPLIIKSLSDYVNRNEIKKSKAKIKTVNDLVYYAKVDHFNSTIHLLAYALIYLFVCYRKYCNTSTLLVLVIEVKDWVIFSCRIC